MLKKGKFSKVIITLIFCLALSACNLNAEDGKVDDIAVQQTSVAQTVVVLQTQLAVNSTPIVPEIATNTPEAIIPTATFTLTPTIQVATPTITSTPLPAYRIGSVVDVNYADNTVVKPNESFTKTWRLTNGGSTTWNSNFKLVFVSGDAMGGPASKAIGQSVGPGQSIDVSVVLKAPAVSKTYQGKWIMQTESGANFGIGANADSPFWVMIKVDQNFALTAATIKGTLVNSDGSCPNYIQFTADVTATSSGKATYYFITSLGNSSLYELPFTAGGTVTTGTYTVQVSVDQTVTASVYNDYPNHQEFGSISIVVDCP